MRMLRAGVAFLVLAAGAMAQDFDVVISRGRVIDPETKFDAVRDVGIQGGKIAAISESPLRGRETVDAHGLVVTAGFIDLHQHGQTPENYEFKARDGVTTALEMEVGVADVPSWYAAREGKSLINFGASVGHIPARMKVYHDSGGLLPRDKAIDPKASPQELDEILRILREGLNDGALGIGIGVAYTPGATRDEIFQVFQLAAERKTTVYVHLRSAGPVEPGGGIDALQEVLSDAAATGAGLHVVHVTSTELRETPVALKMIESAARHGVDVTTEAYPYTAGMTDIASAIFSEGWQARNGGITYKDLQWVETGKRLTEESFGRYRKQGGMVILHAIPEEVVKEAVADPAVMIASDGMLDNGKGHPRTAGSYARVLGKYVRDEHLLSLSDALAKMNLLPANLLRLSNKGRVQVGADADLTIFDPQHVIDRATFEKPAQYSEGIPYVMVNGHWSVKNGEVQTSAFPGRGVRYGR